MKQQKPQNSSQRSLAEKVSLTISLSIVSLIVVLVCYTWFTGDNNPPILSIITATEIREIEQQYYLPFTVSNSGGMTAESVEVTAKLILKNGDIETGRQQINFGSNGLTM